MNKISLDKLLHLKKRAEKQIEIWGDAIKKSSDFEEKNLLAGDQNWYRGYLEAIEDVIKELE